MAIPKAQLETWSHQGAIKTSSDTYLTVKRALEKPTVGYAGRDFEIYLQGSYGNDTNIYAESDVDIVICCAAAFYYDISALDPAQTSAFHAQFNGEASYKYSEFKTAVVSALTAEFGKSVTLGKRAIKIAADGNRRSSDVIAAFEHRRYYSFGAYDQANVHKGISFFNNAGERIDNFPKLHSEHLTTKHKNTGGRLKSAIRIFKNIRSALVDRGAIGKGDAPSYFVEGLLYNVPDNIFVGGTDDTTLGILRWLDSNPDRSQFVCANERYYLLRDGSQVCWPTADGTKFIKAASELWDNSKSVVFI
jgi:hypothetical protein